MKYDSELIVSALDIASDTTVLLALSTQDESHYDKLEKFSNNFYLPSRDSSHFSLEHVHWNYTMQLVAKKLIEISVIVRNLHYHLKKSKSYKNIEKSEKESINQLIDFCNKVIHLTEIRITKENFEIEIEGAQKKYAYNIHRFCSEATSIASFCENYIFEDV